MPILNQGAYQKHGEGDDPLGVHHHEYEMRAGLRNHPQESGDKEDPHHMARDETLKIPVSQPCLH